MGSKMTEYWLQKRTLGGWSNVSWWSEHELEKANTSYQSCLKQVGYSWRLIKVETLQEVRLQEEVEDKVQDSKEEQAKYNVWAGQASSWNVGDKVVANGWGDTTITATAPEKEHGMVGKVWMLHHARKEKIRVDPSQVDSLIIEGWERGGPRTQFRT